MMRAQTAILMAAVAFPALAQKPPDLSGIYDIATLTPLVRPAQYGDRLTLTDAEAQAIERKAEAARAAQNQSSDPKRKAPEQGNVGSYNDLWFDRGVGAIRINGKWRTSIITSPANGQRPEMTPEGKRRAAYREKTFRPNSGEAYWVAEGISPGPYDDPELLPTAERCLLAFGSSAGPPMLPAAYNNLKQIVQTKDTVLIYNEMVHDVRVIRINGQHEPPDIRRWLGDSIGRWEGDTLVVDTTNFNDIPALSGATRSLHVVERFKRLDGNSLLYQFTVEDPTVWTVPWSGEVLWPATTQRVFEYACHEGNYSFGGILRGARLLEAEAEKKKGGR